MRVFVDTNVLIDVLAERGPHFDASAGIWILTEAGRLSASISALSFSTTWYLAKRHMGRPVADAALTKLRDLFEIVDLSSSILHQAIDSGFADFEDAVQFHSAVRSRAKCLLTRNTGHFPDTAMPVMTPAEFLKTHSLG